ncbi:MAG TPA: 4Fe-4S dicluster domain-containing protein [Halanaerobiales bacterium]|nr:4Fe-4S dicluster domain-containing protein [Halanaerobiales bacterium]
MDNNFKNEITSRPGGENLMMCYSCGSCTATCPISEIDESFNPRMIIKKSLLGYKEEVLDNDDLWKCIQCRRCVAHCPQNVKFADIMRVLRNMSIEAGYYPASLKDKVDKLDKTVYQFRLDIVADHLDETKDMQEHIDTMVSGGDRDG